MTTAHPSPTVVIVGAGHAGGTLAGMLRQQKFDGRIVLCGEESHPPYHRPPLSKKYLSLIHVLLYRTSALGLKNMPVKIEFTG
ncbi:Apoptosis-inducing factor 3 [Rhodococcus opacus PD630]|nr:Apoptosis-inducing factor 3 [Rhodococcus opacus PD630]